MFSLLIQNGDGVVQRRELAQGGTTIGRNAENMIVLADGSVSSRHAEIVVGVGKAILRDLNSSNGTIVNGAPITEIALTVGDEIVFGSVVCRVDASTPSGVPATLPAIEPAPLMEEAAAPASKEKPVPDASFSSKLLAFGKAASQEAKRAAQIAGTKAKIEKLKRIDLSNAVNGG